MKIFGGVEMYSTISNLGIKCRGMISFKLRQLYFRRNSPLCALNRSVGVPQRQSGCHAEQEQEQEQEEKSLVLSANGTSIPRSSSP
jgi:hypothetical protein